LLLIMISITACCCLITACCCCCGRFPGSTTLHGFTPGLHGRFPGSTGSGPTLRRPRRPPRGT
jgi:hypothetical protein